MKIAVIGTGNVGGTLAAALHSAAHEVVLGVRNTSEFRNRDSLLESGLKALPVPEAVAQSEVVIIAAPAPQAVSVARSLGDTTGKIIIDTMNIVMGRGPEGYSNTTEAIIENTQTPDVVKCFNSTGFENMQNPTYAGRPIDMFMAGDSKTGKQTATSLAHDIGFGTVYDMGGNDKFFLLEQLANAWINLAIFQGYGRDISIRIDRRTD